MAINFKFFSLIFLSLNISASTLSICIPKCGSHLLSKCIELITFKKPTFLNNLKIYKNSFTCLTSC